MKKVLHILLLTTLVVLIANMAMATTYVRHSDVVRNTSGRTVGGATVTVYLANTTTLATLYSALSGGAQSNPSYTDSAGRFSFYALPGLYDVVVARTGIISYTDEDVRLFSPTASSYSIVDYGAISDDSISDHGPIQAAIDAAEAAGGGRVFVPAGGYQAATDSTLTIDSADVTLAGLGAESRLIGAGGADDIMLEISAANITIQDLTFVGLRSAEADGANECVKLLDGADYVLINNCRFTGYISNWGFNVQIRTEDGADYYTITNNYFERCIGTGSGYGYGIQSQGSSGGLIAHNTSIQASDNGRHHVYLSYGSSNVIISDNVLIGGTSAMITMYDNNSLPNQNCQITNNILDGGGTGGGIEIVDEAFGNLVQGNTIYDVNGFGIKIEGTNETPYHTYDNVLDNNIITDSDSSGIFIKYAKTTMVTDNRLINTGTGGSVSAIWLLDGGSAPCDSTVISGNHVSGSANTYAVTLDGSDIMVFGNFFEPGSAGTYQAIVEDGSQMIHGNIDDRPRYLFYNGNPNTNVTAPIGSVCSDRTNADLYINTNGTTGWSLVGP